VSLAVEAENEFWRLGKKFDMRADGQTEGYVTVKRNGE